MKIALIKRSGTQADITNAVSRGEWSGSASSAARQLTISYVNAPNNSFQLPSIETGDLVSFIGDSGKELFYGQFFGSEKSSAIGSIDYTAYDMMKNLLESEGQYNFKNMTPEAIAAQICAECGFPVQELYATGINIASLLCDGMSLYDVIMAAYTKAHKVTGDKYIPMIYKRGLGIYKMEWIVKGFTLSDASNITASSIKETMDNIVNRVRIFDEKGKSIGEVTDAGSMGIYGTFQKVYKQEKGVDAQTAAKNMLNVLPSQTLSVGAVGCEDCISGYYVMVTDQATGLSGRYWISSDRHTWENGTYTMDLELEFDALMDTVEGKEEENK